MSAEELQFPIGRFQKPNHIEYGNVKIWLQTIETLPYERSNSAKTYSYRRLTNHQAL